MRCVMTLPPGDSNLSLRWRLIKSAFSRARPNTEHRSEVRQAAGDYTKDRCGDTDVVVEGDVQHASELRYAYYA